MLSRSVSMFAQVGVTTAMSFERSKNPRDVSRCAANARQALVLWSIVGSARPLTLTLSRVGERESDSQAARLAGSRLDPVPIQVAGLTRLGGNGADENGFNGGDVAYSLETSSRTSSAT
jgi:hypothetical protein